MRKLKIAFLLGSGISTYAGAPCTKKLTDSLFHNSDVNLVKEQQILIKNFLNDLKSQIEEYNNKLLGKTNVDINYEDIYYFVWQLWNCKKGNNPAIFECYKKLEKKFIKQIKHYFNNESFIDFLVEVKKYIEGIVSRKLNLKLDKSYNYIEVIQNVYKYENTEKIEIFCLNHDTFIEQCFDNKGIEYSDGFKEDVSLNIKVWNSNSFDNEKIKINLYKLHGSLNWYQFQYRIKKKDYVNETGVNIGIKDEHVNNDKVLEIKWQQQIILIGTFNKIFDYLKDIFVELNCRFFQILSECDILVISGYGFNDEGINLYISRFIRSNSTRLTYINEDKHPKKTMKKIPFISDELLDRKFGLGAPFFDHQNCKFENAKIATSYLESIYNALNDIKPS